MSSVFDLIVVPASAREVQKVMRTGLTCSAPNAGGAIAIGGRPRSFPAWNFLLFPLCNKLSQSIPLLRINVFERLCSFHKRQQIVVKRLNVCFIVLCMADIFGQLLVKSDILRGKKQVEILQVPRPFAYVFQVCVRDMVCIQIKILPIRLFAGEQEGNGCEK